MDYSAWVSHVRSFTTHLASLGGTEIVETEIWPPVPANIVKDVEKSLSHPLPEVLRRFATEGAARIRIGYGWNARGPVDPLLREVVRGGIGTDTDMCNLYNYKYLQRGVNDTAATWMERGAELADAVLWSSSIPFLDVGNGDFLGLRRRRENDDAFDVVYLSHDGNGESRILAPSFDEFLCTWEELCYIDIVTAVYFFTDSTSRLITSSSERAHVLRRMLAVGR